VSVAEGFSGRLPRLLVLDASERPGPGYARNRGVEQAQGAKILFVDGEDEVGDGYIDAMAAALDDADLVFARIGLERLNPPWVLRVWSVPWQQTKPLAAVRQDRWPRRPAEPEPPLDLPSRQQLTDRDDVPAARGGLGEQPPHKQRAVDGRRRRRDRGRRGS
jgi:hypothetical protein